ncbi:MULTISPECIES: hypothetical protein [Burkholderia cepacia complex]|uniref:Uncharacterized protein n=2 Tax=Burkholderia multivorans TaxID=87883 RepID=A0AAP2MS59_9BURK|nr:MULTISPECIES: hypothetical protein [Burkholderia cepacia complex]MBJ9624934.1 hypothetical protein [Burkholderia multivorans]MBU9360509.1 hypothetical protein [Burkholderia multivorans]MCA8464015.1 hypothetical protein [Burkholderia multivorans]MDN7436874.1 hypothetical protein [Burkholderia multivorans]MDN8103912.1 hypothetical protein [Burkholderia multivorans]
MKRGRLPTDVALLVLSLISRKGSDMPAVTRKELLQLGQVFASYEKFPLSVALKEVVINGNRWWRMVVTLPDGKELDVQTALAKTKLFRRADIALDFVKDTLPGVTDVRFEFLKQEI